MVVEKILVSFHQFAYVAAARPAVGLLPEEHDFHVSLGVPVLMFGRALLCVPCVIPHFALHPFSLGLSLP